MLLLLALTGVVGVFEIRSAASTYEGVSEDSARRTKDALELRVALERQVAGVRGFVLSGRVASLEPYVEGTEDFPRQLREAREKGISVDDRALLDRVERDHGRLQVAFEAVLQRAAAGDRTDAEQLLQRRVEPLKDSTRASVDEFVRRQADAFVAGRAASHARGARAERVLWTLLAGVVLVGVLVAGLVVRRLDAAVPALREQRDYAAALIASMQDGWSSSTTPAGASRSTSGSAR
jgi:CHASE3 domain sensor protein